jgi:hypothetical protein
VVIQDIKNTAALFKSCSFVHVPRSLNESVHVLARNSELLDFITFCNYVPVCIQEILCNDYVSSIKCQNSLKKFKVTGHCVNSQVRYIIFFEGQVTPIYLFCVYSGP